MTTRDLRALVTRIDELGQRSRWPGFDPRTIPLALATGDQTLLVNHPQPPEDFEPISEWPGAYLFPGRYPAMRANTAIALGGTLIAVVLLNRTSRHTRMLLPPSPSTRCSMSTSACTIRSGQQMKRKMRSISSYAG